MNKKSLPVFVFLILGLLSSSAFGYSSYLSTWQGKYPSSQSDNNIINGTSASCQLCHFNSSGGDPFNAYGWSLREDMNNNGKTISQAINDVEALDSDSDPSHYTNLEEINADVQPGWTDGANNIKYFTSGSQTTGQTPPSNVGDLDITISSCNYSISPDSQSFFIGGGIGNIVITTSESCGWTALSDSEWVVITPTISGTGNGVITYTVSENTDPDKRTGIITIEGVTHTVTQDGTAEEVLADLTATSVKLPASVKKGQKVSVKAIIENTGDEDSTPCKISFYLSRNNGKTVSGDKLLATRLLVELNNGAGTTVVYKWKVKASPGKYYIKAFSDSTAQINESNEDNNVAVSKRIKVK